MNRRTFVKTLGALTLAPLLPHLPQKAESKTNGGYAVIVDDTSPYSGTVHPIGTVSTPVNNIKDALKIARSRGIYNIKYVDGPELPADWLETLHSKYGCNWDNSSGKWGV